MDKAINKDNEVQLITRLRSVSVFLIVLAHCSVIPENASTAARKIMEFCSSISFFGVWVFFTIGGYLLAYENRPMRLVLKRKIKTIVLPWVFTGTIVYFYTFLRHGEISPVTCVKFLSGYGSYLWYMSVYAVLLIVFLAFRSWKCFPWIVVGISLAFSTTDFLYVAVGERYELYYFLGGWPIAFGLGYLLNVMHLQMKIKKYIIRYGMIWTLATIVFLFVYFAVNGRWFYWSKCYLWISISVLPAIVYIANRLGSRFGRVIDRIGRDSFTIYLIHMPVVGAVNNILCRVDGGYSVALRPFLVIGITEVLISMICYISRRMKCEKAANLLLGRR